MTYKKKKKKKKMEDDKKKNGKRPKQKWNMNQSTKINLIGCDTIVNSPSLQQVYVAVHKRKCLSMLSFEIINPKTETKIILRPFKFCGRIIKVHKQSV